MESSIGPLIGARNSSLSQDQEFSNFRGENSNGFRLSDRSLSERQNIVLSNSAGVPIAIAHGRNLDRIKVLVQSSLSITHKRVCIGCQWAAVKPRFNQSVGTAAANPKSNLLGERSIGGLFPRIGDSEIRVVGVPAARVVGPFVGSRKAMALSGCHFVSPVQKRAAAGGVCVETARGGRVVVGSASNKSEGDAGSKICELHESLQNKREKELLAWNLSGRNLFVTPLRAERVRELGETEISNSEPEEENRGIKWWVYK